VIPSNSHDPFDPSDSFDPFEPFESSDSSASTDSTRPARPANYSRSSERGATRAAKADKAPGDKPARSLKGRALGYLSRREYSRRELAGKLAAYVEEGDNLEALLDALEQEGWLSDVRFAHSLLHRRAGRLGASRVVGELKRHALDAGLLGELDAQLRDTEAERAKAVWQKKFGVLPQTPAERAKQARFLAMRGFSHAAIARLLRGLDDELDLPEGDSGD
jgi:regulatory protein